MHNNTKRNGIIVAIVLVVAALAWFLFGKGEMNMSGKTAENGDNVVVDYVGTFEDGTMFDTNIEQLAKDNALYSAQRSYAGMEFTIGAHQVVAGFENALVGMKEGETKKVTLTPDLAYGEVMQDRIVSVPLSGFTSAGQTPEIGQVYMIGQQERATVKEISGETVVLDFNSPMAGKTLVFEITLKDIANK